MASFVSSLPWFWVIEALASLKQVDESILIGTWEPEYLLLNADFSLLFWSFPDTEGLFLTLMFSFLFILDLIKRAPEISNDLGKNEREMVSVRFLESFIAHRVGSIKGVSSVPDSKIEFDPSEHCEDVVRKILHEVESLGFMSVP